MNIKRLDALIAAWSGRREFATIDPAGVLELLTELKQEREHAQRMRAHAAGAAKRENKLKNELRLAESKIQSLRDRLANERKARQ